MTAGWSCGVKRNSRTSCSGSVGHQAPQSSETMHPRPARGSYTPMPLMGGAYAKMVLKRSPAGPSVWIVPCGMKTRSPAPQPLAPLLAQRAVVREREEHVLALAFEHVHPAGGAP